MKVKKYRWTYVIEVDAQDDIEAEARVTEALDEALSDPDTIISHGKLEEIEK